MNRNKKPIAAMLLVFALAMLLSGCLYPGNNEPGGNVTTGESIILVENAVHAYQNRTGVLPIHNSEIGDSAYEKYRIDFTRLREYNVLGHIPPDAFEEGGNYYYMIVDPEGEMRVKLMDLRVSIAAADVQRMVDNYRLQEGELPLGEQVGEHFYVLDFARMGQKQQQARSVYSEQYLIYLLHDSGKAVIDYAPEIMKLIQQAGGEPEGGKEDLRRLLVEQSPFVPVSSSPYYWVNGKPAIEEQ